MWYCFNCDNITIKHIDYWATVIVYMYLTCWTFWCKWPGTFARRGEYPSTAYAVPLLSAAALMNSYFDQMLMVFPIAFENCIILFDLSTQCSWLSTRTLEWDFMTTCESLHNISFHQHHHSSSITFTLPWVGGQAAEGSLVEVSGCYLAPEIFPWKKAQREATSGLTIDLPMIGHFIL